MLSRCRPTSTTACGSPAGADHDRRRGPRPRSDTGDATRYLLGKEAYLSAEWFAREQRDLLGRIWNLVAYESDLPEAGDRLPVQVGTEPVLLVRTEDGRIRGYLNMCRYRGMALVCEAGHHDGDIRCRYHGWEYAPADGTLVRIPQRAAQFADVDPGDWGLLPVATDTWFGIVFVNPDPAAAPLADWLGSFVDHMGPSTTPGWWRSPGSGYRSPATGSCTWRTTSTCCTCGTCTTRRLGMYDHANFHHRKVGPHWVSDERLRDGQRRDRGGALLPISHLPEAERSVLRAN